MYSTKLCSQQQLFFKLNNESPGIIFVALDYQNESMSRLLSVLLTFATLLIGCDSIELDPNYPTTIKRLPDATLEQLRKEFALKNMYLKSSLNEFGFCSRNEHEVDAMRPPIMDTLKESEVFDLIRTFVSQNPSATGVGDIKEFCLSKIKSNSDSYDGSIMWIAETPVQTWDTIEVLQTKILFRILNRELVSCRNNWFPEIYIPEEFRVGIEEAKSLLIDKEVSHYTIAGIEWVERVTESSLEESQYSLKILPIWYEDRIELRVVWEINVPHPVYYIFYVDVMSGRILGKKTTIVS